MKYFELWTGNDRFYCSAFRTGPSQDIIANLYLHLSLILPLAIYFGFCFNKLWNEATPILPIANIILYILTAGSIMLTSFTDPGIIPPKKILLLMMEQGAIDEDIADFLLNGDGQALKCPTCEVFRPPRSAHCRECDHCVEVMDHHCPFVNACVAKRNYQFFFFFLFFLFFFICSVIVGIAIFLTVISSGFSPETARILLIVFGVILGITTLVLGGFLIVHCLLAITGRTTRQTLKGLEFKQKTGFNWLHKDPVLIDFWKEVPESHVSHESRL